MEGLKSVEGEWQFPDKMYDRLLANKFGKIFLQPFSAEIEAGLPLGVNQIFLLGMRFVITYAEINSTDLVADDADISKASG